MTKPADIGTNADIVRIRLESAAEKLLFRAARKNMAKTTSSPRTAQTY